MASRPRALCFGLLLFSARFTGVTKEELNQIAVEIRTTLVGLRFGRLFSLSSTAFAVDLHPHSGAYLFIDISPRYRSVYLIVRKLKTLERESTNPNPFQLQLRQALSGCALAEVSAVDEGIALRFKRPDGNLADLLVLVSANPANIVLIDRSGAVILAARDANIVSRPVFTDEGQENAASKIENLSAFLDNKRIENDKAEQFNKLSNEALKRVKREIAKRYKLLSNLDSDLEKHGNAEKWKRFGDLILASLPSPKREGDSFLLIDFFEADQPEILIPADANDSPKVAAEKFYKNYRKASNALEAIAKRKAAVEEELNGLTERLRFIEIAIERADIGVLLAYVTPVDRVVEKPKKDRNAPELKGVRRFASSNGFEILVGKKAKDNDSLTFRIAKSLDTWLHAADYPGSHVVIRNPNRKEIPTQTLIEAASLAAFYSDAREMTKAAVNYTQRKFVNKPKRAAPGLVSLSSFKTLVVKPEVATRVQKIDG